MVPTTGLQHPGWVAYRSPDGGWSLQYPAELVEEPFGANGLVLWTEGTAPDPVTGLPVGEIVLQIQHFSAPEPTTGAVCDSLLAFVADTRYAEAETELRETGWVDHDLDGVRDADDPTRYVLSVEVAMGTPLEFSTTETWYWICDPQTMPDGGFLLSSSGIEMLPGNESLVPMLESIAATFSLGAP